MVGGDGEGMLNQQPIAEHPPKRHKPNGDSKKARGNDRKLHRRLAALAE